MSEHRAVIRHTARSSRFRSATSSPERLPVAINASAFLLLLGALNAPAQNCPDGGFLPQPTSCPTTYCRPDGSGLPATWYSPSGAGSRTWQYRRATRSPNSNAYPVLPTNSYPGCRFSFPASSPAGAAALRVQGRRVLVDFEAPNYYCFDDGAWPIGYCNLGGDIAGTANRLVLYINGFIERETWIYFDYGTWDTGYDLPCPGTTPVNVEAEIRYVRSGTTSTAYSSGVQSFQLAEPCATPDRGSCPAGGDGRVAGTGVGLPINVGSGDVSTTLPLFSIQQPPLSLAFDLAYHSSPRSYSGISLPEPLGAGWTHPFNQILVPIPSTNRLYHYTADGREHEYTASGATWVASRPAELRGTVTLDAGSGEYRLADLAGNVTAFHQATGRWKATRDRWGNELQGLYTGSDLMSVVDSAGRSIVLGYSGGRLQSITVPDSPSRVWTFSYGGAASLLYAIRDPFHSTGNAWRSIGYDGGSRLISITDDASKLLEGHTYDTQGRGKTSYAEGGQKDYVLVEYDVPLPGQRRVTHRIDATTSQVSVFSAVYQGGRWLPVRIDGPCSTCGGAAGDSEVFSYTVDNHVETVVDGRGYLTRFGYDASGNLASMVEAEGTAAQRTTTWTYGNSTWPSFWTVKIEPSVVSGARTTTRTWSAGETVLTTTEVGSVPGAGTESHLTTQTFDARHRVLSVDGPRAGTVDVTTYAYFPDAPGTSNGGRLQSVTDAVGLVTTLANYDVYGSARTTTDANGVTIELVSDARGRTISRTMKALSGDPEPSDYVTTYVYDTRDRLARLTFPRGNGIRYAYEDGTNRLLATIRVDSGDLERERLLVTRNDIGGRTREEAQVCDSPATTCPAWTTRRSERSFFDTKNRLSQVLFPVPLPEDSVGITYAYDGGGFLASVKDERHTAPSTLYDYDPLGRLQTVTQKMPLAGKPDVVTVYGYDAHDNLTTLTDPNGNVTTWVWDDFRRLQSQASPVTGTTTYTYDEAGNLLTSTDANGASTTRTYDGAGRLLTATSARTGRPTEVVTNVWDDPAVPYGEGRLRSASVTVGGSPTAASTYTWDRRGLPRAETQAILGTAYAASFGNDANGNRTRVTYPSGREVTYTFDSVDRPVSASSATTTYVSAVAYEPFGPEKSLTFGNGTTRTATWNARFQPGGLTLTGEFVGSAVSYSYALDALGNITGITDGADSSYNRTFGYDDLNRLTSATTSTTGSPALWGMGTFAYDALGNRTALTFGSRSATYAYDVVSGKTTSRLASVTEGGGTSLLVRDAVGNETAFGPTSSLYSARNSLAATGLSAFRYDARGVRVAEEISSGSGLYTVTPCRLLDTRNPNGAYGGPHIPAGGTRTFTFQGQCGIAPGARAVALNVTVASPSTSGSLALFPADVPPPGTSSISLTPGKTRANNGILGLSLLGDMTIFNSSSAEAPTIVDVSGYFKEQSVSRRAFIYAPEFSLLAETNATSGTPTPLYEYIWLGGRPVAQETVGDVTGLRFTLTDHLGTPLLQTNAAGAVAWRVEHEPFGSIWAFRTGSAAAHQPLRLPGQEERPSSPARFYNVFRWYRPDLGQYSQGDRFLPISHRDPSAFVYVNSKPLVSADPLGLFEVTSSCDTGCTFPGNIGRSLAQACSYLKRPKCQEALNRVWGLPYDRVAAGKPEAFGDCMRRRCSAGEIGKGPQIRCSNRTDACGEFFGTTLNVWVGNPSQCPRFTFDPTSRTFTGARDYSHTIFHETMHSCGMPAEGSKTSAVMSTYFGLIETCTGLGQ